MHHSLRLLPTVVTVVACVSWALGPLHAATYIVDVAAPGAADTNAGTEKQPFRTIAPAVALLKPGDTVLVLAGRYDERITIRTSGTASQPIILRAIPRGSASVRGFDLRADWIQVEGFEITADKPAVAVQLQGSHCTVTDNFIHDMMVGVAGTDGRVGPDGIRDYAAVTGNRIAYNKVHHSQYGFMLGGNDWRVENNEVSRLFMYTPGNKYDDCDYSRFFGRGCVQRWNYYHGSVGSEIRVAHVDCLQMFTVNGEIAQDLTFEHNTCFDFHQMCMVESAPHLGSVRGWALRGNIVSANAPALSGGWGPDIIQTPDVTIANNTIVGVRWATIGLRGRESTNGLIQNNILADAERAVIAGDADFTTAELKLEHNLTFKTSTVSGDRNLNGKDPLLVDPARRGFRLRSGSPAIGAGSDGGTIGALAYPNVYYVDPRHPAATDEPGWGYPAVPLATLARACALAQPAETVVLRGGVYRETLRPTQPGVRFRAMDGEDVTLSRADLIDDWRREPDGNWSAPLAAPPKTILRDGQPWTHFVFDPATRRISVKCADPRLHLFETVVRDQTVDRSQAAEVTLEGIKMGR